MSEVTRILTAIEQGDRHAAEQLLPVVYDELRKLAAQKLALEQPGITLQATALVHEAYLRLVAGNKDKEKGRPGDKENPKAVSLSPGLPVSPPPALPVFGRAWDSRGHFFAAAAEAMRRILVEQARRRHAAKRGGQRQRVELSEDSLTAPMPDDELLALNDALEQFTTVDPAAAQLVRLRFFAGLNMSEAAAALGVSVRTAHDLWAYARSWLRRRMHAD